jgi:D-amino peptidase
MKKLFLSADMEGTCGIMHWDETEKNHPDYAYFANQMSREVAAACAGAHEAGYDQVLVKDAHDSARNINPLMLPQYASIIRGWGGHPYSMMLGLDSTFDGVVFTGYHNAAGTDSNPLSHTMVTNVVEFRINGELASELHMNSLTAAREGVPVYAVTGDDGICAWMKEKTPNTVVVPVNFGMGGASRSLHPTEAVERIQEAVKQAVQQPRESCLFPMPEHFHIEVMYREHARAHKLSFYPGVKKTSPRILTFETNDYFEVLRFAHFAL